MKRRTLLQLSSSRAEESDPLMATMLDVARRAGVSVSTVSYALSGARPISDETRQRIHTAVEELGYQPHALARGLASKRSKIIALVYPPVNRTMAAGELTFVTSVADAARSVGYSLVLSTFASDNLLELRQLAQQGLVDGMILMEVHLEDARVALLQELAFPFSMIGHCRDNDGIGFVDVDFHQTACDAVEYLAGLGHQRLAFVTFAPEVVAAGYGPAVRTQEAFEEALHRSKLEGSAYACEPTSQAGYELAVELLSGQRPCTGLLTFNERCVPGILQAAQDRGLRIPDDLSLIAISSPAVALIFTPALTTYDLPIAEMGRIGTEILVRQLEGANPEPTQLLLPCRLVARESSGPYRQRMPMPSQTGAVREQSPVAYDAAVGGRR
jgi:DNA-binding LacI/PurR family transcriptional regulator